MLLAPSQSIVLAAQLLRYQWLLVRSVSSGSRIAGVADEEAGCSLRKLGFRAYWNFDRKSMLIMRLRLYVVLRQKETHMACFGSDGTRRRLSIPRLPLPDDIDFVVHYQVHQASQDRSFSL